MSADMPPIIVMEAPCPFHGGEDLTWRRYWTRGRKYSSNALVHCKACNREGKGSLKFKISSGEIVRMPPGRRSQREPCSRQCGQSVKVGSQSGLCAECRKADAEERERARYAERVVMPWGVGDAERDFRNSAPWVRLRKERLALATAGSEPCGLCGLEIDYGLSGQDLEGPTIDHVVPVSDGGDLFPPMSGLQPAHRICQNQQGGAIRNGLAGVQYEPAPLSECRGCGGPMRATRRGRKHYCSTECWEANKAARMKPSWRVSWRCQACGLWSEEVQQRWEPHLQQTQSCRGSGCAEIVESGRAREKYRATRSKGTNHGATQWLPDLLPHMVEVAKAPVGTPRSLRSPRA